MRVRVKVRVRVRVVVGAEVAPAPVVGEEQQHVRSGDEHRRSQQEEHLARGGGAEGRSGLLAEAEEVAAGDGGECLSGVVLPNLRGGRTRTGRARWNNTMVHGTWYRANLRGDTTGNIEPQPPVPGVWGAPKPHLA